MACLRRGWLSASLALSWSLALAAADPCADWTLPLLRDPAAGDDLRIGLEHRAAPPAGGVWAFYALVLPGPGPDGRLTGARLAAAQPPPRPLGRSTLAGRTWPAYTLSGWYDSQVPRVLYLIRLPAAEPRFAVLGLGVEPHDPGTPSPGTAAKFFGLLPPKVLDLEPVSPQGFGPGALVCRARSPAQ